MGRRTDRNPRKPRPEKTSASPSPPAPTPSPSPVAAPPFWNAQRTTMAVLVLLAIHASLAVRSLVAENPTVDEVIHMPAGLTYWQTGSFRLYRHNPPLVKLVAALPVLAAAPAMDYNSPSWKAEPPNKAMFAHEFMRLNAANYFPLFTRARLLMPLFSLVGALTVFAWSRTLYGNAGGLLSLALWAFCPNVLAHTRLVTTDIGATSLGALATFLFWRYLEAPTWRKAALAGLALGLGQFTKFSLLLLYGLWPLLAIVAILTGGPIRRSIPRTLLQGFAIVALSVLVIDVGYGFEGVGVPLGQYEFTCQTLTKPVPPGMARPRHPDPLLETIWRFRVNRFRGSWLGSVPAPLPKHYLLGFDDQKVEAEGYPLKFMQPEVTGPEGDRIKGYPVYLDGTLRQTSWWYYYLLTLVYKVPEGTWLLVLASLVVAASSARSRASAFDEIAVLTIPVVVVFVMSVFTNINLGLRYVLPIFPYLYISAGKLAPWCLGIAPGVARRLAVGLVGVGLTATAASTLAVHPHYLAYFNWVSGGPDRGAEHLIDSNLDWGQDLVGLRRWLAKNAPGERVGLAYFGQINPRVFDASGEGFDWFLPPPEPGSMPQLPPRYEFDPENTALKPGLYAVSASLVKGLPWRVYDRPWRGFDETRWAPWQAWFNVFGYFRDLKPVAKVGHSIFIYRVSPEDAARLAHYWAPGAPRRPQPPD